MRHPGVVLIASFAGALALAGSQGVVSASDREGTLSADLEGFEEPPAVSTTGHGAFRARVTSESFTYVLSYEDLEGDVTQAHIHVAQKGVNGGISVWLCGTTDLPGPEGTPVCPGPHAGTVRGTVTPAQVIGPNGQGVAPGEFAELLGAFRDGVTYANVHSTRNQGGEIRGQIKARRGN